MASLHHLVCWNPDYVGKAVEKHLSVIHGAATGADSDGTVWWGKFRVPLDEQGNPGEEYEPYGESKSGEDAAREVAEFKERIRSGQEVRLYIHNPNPPMTECHVARVVDIHYGESATIPKDSQGRPACARIPDYYFHHKASGRCQGCRALDPKCRLKHECGFWYKLDAIKPNPHGELYKGLLDAKTGAKLNFAVTLLYPLSVQEESGTRLFEAKSGVAPSVTEPHTPWQESFPLIEQAERIRDMAINQFVKGTFEKADDLAKAEFFLNRYLLDDAAMYLAHRYEKVLNFLERMNGDVERDIKKTFQFLKALETRGRITEEQFKVLKDAIDVRNCVFHAGKPATQRQLLSLLEGLKKMDWH